jgi:hypothetical protein
MQLFLLNINHVSYPFRRFAKYLIEIDIRRLSFFVLFLIQLQRKKRAKLSQLVVSVVPRLLPRFLGFDIKKYLAVEFFTSPDQ